MKFGKPIYKTCFILMLSIVFATTSYGQSNEQEQVKATIKTFFDGFHKGDSSMVASVMTRDAILQTIGKNKAGKTLLRQEGLDGLLKAIAYRPDDQKWDERLLDYDINIDGAMAHAWTPYEFWFNDAFSHCGVNSFQLFKSENGWKIIYLIDTRRRTGCTKAE
ncbi:nuclear transport factor 2 family protein [Gaetbulibacter aestuarii]|uniref:Nuclear transport factor 2 family protein n=1 Tax=Gaetbulibacter aestuarii TaxID=1502358 RepID=A0ABW7N140_9FLAO